MVQFRYLIGVDNLIIFEPQKHCYDQLTSKAKRIGLYGTFVNKPLGNFVGRAEITSDPTGLTGSLLEPGLVVDYPDIVFSEKFMVDVSTLDDEIDYRQCIVNLKKSLDEYRRIYRSLDW